MPDHSGPAGPSRDMPGEPVTVLLDGITHGGEAVGRLNGKAVFVPFGIPGEEALVRVTRDHGSYARGQLLEAPHPSPHRRAPACPHFGPGLCGGCHWQHMDYALQVELKARIVREQLQRIGGLADPPVRPAVGMAEPWAYRNHVQLVVGEGGALAYQAAGTNRPVAVSRCPIAHALLAGMVGTPGSAPAAPAGWRLPPGLDRRGITRVSLRAGTATGQAMMILGSPRPLPAWRGGGGFAVAVERPGGVDMLHGQPYLEERLGGHVFRVSPRSFFQVNTAQAERLAELVAGYAALAGGETVLDCFCGVGVFGLLLAPTARRVFGIEEGADAVADARHNAAGVDNFVILQGRAEAVTAGLDERIDVAVIDPPRQGCAPPVIAALARLAPQRIVYVSCDPATLARDVAALARAGYGLREASPVDMFPQTYHVETVCLLTRAE